MTYFNSRAVGYLFFFALFLATRNSAQSCVSNNYAYGLPLSENKVTCLNHTAFVVGYSEKYKNPLWVVYTVKAQRLHNNYKRYRFFSTDKRTKSKVEYYDYSGSGYSRGHLAPASTVYYGFGEEAMRETFLMTNIVPQKYEINGNVWATLEDLERRLARKLKQDILVISGPVFDAHRQTLDKCSRKFRTCRDTGIEIPDQFYKIILFKNLSGEYSALAFLVNHRSTERDTKKLLVSVDAIEEISGLNFFPQLAEEKSAQENKLILEKLGKENFSGYAKSLESFVNHKDFAKFAAY